jgi:cell division protein FtsB
VSRPARRILWSLFVVATIVGALSLSVFPARTWLGQQQAISASKAQLAELDAELAELESRLEALDSPEEIERLARERYNMVRPGEEAYGILPTPAAPLDIPPGFPFTDAPAPHVD